MGSSTEDEHCIKQNINSQFNKVLIIGLGQLGLPVARYLSEKGFDTYGYDLSHHAIERAEKTAGIKEAMGLIKQGKGQKYDKEKGKPKNGEPSVNSINLISWC
jgi:UDP-N-acetyl-D-mannosaminuronate dehydrogenase